MKKLKRIMMLGLVHFVGGFEHRRIFGDIACAEVVGIAADDGNRFVNENPTAGGLAVVIALCDVDNITRGGFFQGVPDGLQRRIFGCAFVLFLADAGGDIPIRAEGGHGEREAEENGQQFFHVRTP